MTPHARAIGIAAAAAVLVGAVVTHAAAVSHPAGRWALSLVGAGVRWQDPYRALESPEGVYLGLGQNERLRIANAMAEGEPPKDFPMGRRLHRPGTLARLKYETLDADGRPLDTWFVRALVPALPYIENYDRRGVDTPLLGEGGCRTACLAQEKKGATILVRSGDAGLAAEWVLRMPLDHTFSLGRRSISTHDVLDETAREMPLSTRRLPDGRSVQEPADIRVTLVEACEGRLLMGTATQMNFAENAIVPVPRGFSDFSWVQIDGCGRLEPTPRPVAPSANAAAASRPAESGAPAESEPSAPSESALSPAPAATPSAPPAPPLEIRSVVLKRDAKTGHAVLEVNESWFDAHPKTVDFALHFLCRYDPKTDAWTQIPRPDHGWAWLIPPREPEARKGALRHLSRPVVALPTEAGLYWLQWIERLDGERSVSSENVRQGLVTSGRILCNDVMRGPAPEGKVAACVPFPNRAEARFVPSPREACAR